MISADKRYTIAHTVSGNATARRDSLVGEGPLKISDEHFFVKALPPEEVPSRGGGENEWTMRKTEFLFLEHLDWAPELMARSFCWSMLPARATKILKDLDTNGSLKDGQDA